MTWRPSCFKETDQGHFTSSQHFTSCRVALTDVASIEKLSGGESVPAPALVRSRQRAGSESAICLRKLVKKYLKRLENDFVPGT